VRDFLVWLGHVYNIRWPEQWFDIFLLSFFIVLSFNYTAGNPVHFPHDGLWICVGFIWSFYTDLEGRTVLQIQEM